MHTNDMKIIGIELDGTKNFITVYNHKGTITYPLKFKKTSSEAIRFTSMESAKSAADTIFNSINDKVFFRVTIGKREYDMKKAMFVDGYFQLYDTHRNIKYYIKEKKEPKVKWIGYISLDNGYNERKDKSYGIARSKELFANIENAAQKLMLRNDTDSISTITKISNRNYVLSVKNSTAKIHLMSNSNIMDLNQRRKEKGERVIPFNKDVDKFLTIYVYITAENSEMKFFNSAEKSLNILNILIDDIYTNYPDMNTLELVKLEFNSHLVDNI